MKGGKTNGRCERRGRKSEANGGGLEAVSVRHSSGMGLDAKLFICGPKLLRIRMQQPKAKETPPGIISPTASRQIYGFPLCSSFLFSHAFSTDKRGSEREQKLEGLSPFLQEQV